MSKDKAEFTDFHAALCVVNNTKALFSPESSECSSGKITEFKKITPDSTISDAFYVMNTGTWTGIVANATWECGIGLDEIATLKLDVDMPFDGRNRGSLVGNTTFNKYFELSCTPEMPSYGMVWNATVTITKK